MTISRIYTDPCRVPVNRVAKRVLEKGVTHTPPRKVIKQLHWDTPPKMCETPITTPDLTGETFGSLTVIGWYAEGKKSWVVKCSCGKYETRKSKAIRNPANNTDACQSCRHLMHLEYKQGCQTQESE